MRLHAMYICAFGFLAAILSINADLGGIIGDGYRSYDAYNELEDQDQGLKTDWKMPNQRREDSFREILYDMMKRSNEDRKRQCNYWQYCRLLGIKTTGCDEYKQKCNGM